MQLLPDIPDFEVPDGATTADLMAAAAKQLQLPPAPKLVPLPGFAAPWERALLAGRPLAPGDRLRDAGVAEGGVVTYVRVELLAEGWKVHTFRTRQRACARMQCMQTHDLGLHPGGTLYATRHGGCAPLAAARRRAGEGAHGAVPNPAPVRPTPCSDHMPPGPTRSAQRPRTCALPQHAR